MAVVYLLLDVSGSTVRNGFHQRAAQALPAVVDRIERARGDQAWLGMVTYADQAALLIPLTRVTGLHHLPVPRPGGFSSLAAGLRMLASCTAHDTDQLAADGFATPRPIVVIVADGLPTDRDTDVLAARAALDADVHALLPGHVPALAAAGLRATLHHHGPEHLPDLLETLL
ncbi:vWA domain-containing protein [Actinoplanes flavus]|uniref:VWA domain-containing protein n=1 Tax=Actinoplanes flavus TaxID=2820290 RepID=A0ABS3UJ82_9ACTN|nr:vWA domain-containing protein [Actinoplanes flavus]MBO3737808.1 VWA domain-containing protein [Actinoplanes flavus]